MNALTDTSVRGVADRISAEVTRRMSTDVALRQDEGTFGSALPDVADRAALGRALISEALADKLRADNGNDKPWITAFGKLRHLRKETARINRVIEEEFEQIEAEDRL